MINWEQELSEIIAKKESEEIDRFRENLRKAGRSAPCRYFFLMPPFCSLGHPLGCLTCSDYKPHETPGMWGKGYCQFECGKLLHLVDDMESDGFYRSGITLCGRVVSEEHMPVEIYPIDSFDELQAEGVCKRCQKELARSELLIRAAFHLGAEIVEE